MSELEKLESLLLSYRKSLEFSIQTENKYRKKDYQNRIRETERAIKEFEQERPIENIARLYKINDDLKAEIVHLKTEKEQLISEFEETQKSIDRLINPEAEPESIPIPEPEPEKQEPETVENEQISCQYCGKMMNGERGLRVHLSQWCSKIKEGVKVD